MKLLHSPNRNSLDYFKTQLFVAGVLISCLIMNAILDFTSVSSAETGE